MQPQDLSLGFQVLAQGGVERPVSVSDGSTIAPEGPFMSVRQAAFDALLTAGLGPADAVASLRVFEAGKSLGPCAVYVSTAITSGGFVRTAVPDDAAAFADAKHRNEDIAGRLLAEALRGGATAITPTNMLIPTELGRVVGWSDTDYLQFYFAYARGLAAGQARQFDADITARLMPDVRGVANNRALTNDERWPDYREATELMLGALDELDRDPNADRFPQLPVLFQLVDPGWSLGCRAEQLFAEHFGMDILTLALDRLPIDALPQLTRCLNGLQATGAPPFPETAAVMVVPSRLNAYQTAD
jgi:hypothetical protein